MEDISRLSTVNILVVDDDRIIRLTLPLVLCSLGRPNGKLRFIVNAEAIGSCEEALVSLQNSSDKFDMLLTDHNFKGGMNGIEFLRQTKEMRELNNIAAFLLTGDPSVPDEHKGELEKLKAGCLVKSCDGPKKYEEVIAAVYKAREDRQRIKEPLREEVRSVLPKLLDGSNHKLTPAA